MPSDPRVRDALALLTQPIGRFRSAVAATLEEVRAQLCASQAGAAERTEYLKSQFGRFADGRLDLSRLAPVLTGGRRSDPLERARLEAAFNTLQEIAAHDDEAFCLHVPSGTAVDVAVAARLAAIGRAFGAARVAASACGLGTVLGMTDEQAMSSFPFAEWTAAERRLAPPLVVSISGQDLNVAALARFLDGGLKILLLVDGPCAPASLVRLITPNVFVAQVHEVRAAEAIGDWPGAGIAAVVPPASAVFVHDPAAGAGMRPRLTVTKSHDGQRTRIGELSTAQQNEEILQLELLASTPALAVSPASSPAPAGAPASDVDRLAAWLLRQADLSDTGRR